MAIPKQAVQPTFPTIPVQPVPVAAPPVGTHAVQLSESSDSAKVFYEGPHVIPVVTLLGVIVTIIFGWHKMKYELKAASVQAAIERDQSREQANFDRQHAAEQAHQERITKARRDVYLELISEMTKAQSALSLLPMQEIEKIDVQSGFGGLITATSKISVLGEMPTVVMSRELLTAIHEALFRLLTRLLPMHEQKITGAASQQKFIEQNLEVQRLAAEIQTIRETTQNSLECETRVRALNFRLADAEKFSEATIEAKLQFYALQKTYGEAMLEELKIISRKVDELIFSIRTELSLETSLEQLRATTDAMHAAAESASQQLHERLNGAVEAISK